MTLDNKQIRRLRKLAHPLKPVVLTGQAGLSDSVIEEIDRALEFHELIKVRINAADRETRRTMVEEICRRTESEAIQLIGHIAALYRKKRDGKARITLF